MKIYEWNIVFNRFTNKKICIASHTPRLYSELFSSPQTGLPSHKNACNLLLTDYEFLKSTGDEDSLEQVFRKIGQAGCLGIVDGRPISFGAKVFFTRRLKKQLKRLRNSKGEAVSIEKYVAVPNFWEPMFIFSAEDVRLFAYIFGKMLISQKLHKRIVYRVLFFVSRLKFYSVLEYLFSTTYLICRNDR